MNTSKEHIATLRRAVEGAVGRPMETHRDFDCLSERIFSHVGELVSHNTLKRIWGKMDEEREPRLSTLSILSRFIGYPDFNAFVRNTTLAESDGDSSSPFMGRRLSTVDGLTRGDRIRLKWQPGRVCDVQYNGSMHFSVIHSENTRLKPGDTFLCGIIIEGQPLYLDQLQQGENPPTAYICGKKGGVMFELVGDCKSPTTDCKWVGHVRRHHYVTGKGCVDGRLRIAIASQINRLPI